MTNPASRHDSIRAARLAGVQTLYEIEISDVTVDQAVLDFMSKRWSDPEIQPGGIEPDRSKLVQIVRGVTDGKNMLDEMITGVLSDKHRMGRLDVLLRAILRAGALEIYSQPEVPAKVVITEYLEIAHDFYQEGEPALVNGVLDNLARRLRPAEFEAAAKAAGEGE